MDVEKIYGAKKKGWLQVIFFSHGNGGFVEVGIFAQMALEETLVNFHGNQWGRTGPHSHSIVAGPSFVLIINMLSS